MGLCWSRGTAMANRRAAPYVHPTLSRLYVPPRQRPVLCRRVPTAAATRSTSTGRERRARSDEDKRAFMW
eukprot:8948-Eustigmatos_ZCMA.PRE.1